MIKSCEICGHDFVARRSTAKYCSNRCRLMAQRGVAYTGDLKAPDVRPRLSHDEIMAIITQAHMAASDLSRASSLVPAPLSGALAEAARKIEDAMKAEGL